MKARSIWKIADPADDDRSKALSSTLSIPVELASLLIQRGFDSADVAKRFLRPTLDSLSDPFAIADMDTAARLIGDTVRAGRRIMVHGDYDVDGQCATALLTRVLRAAGADVLPFVPNRLRDGYDLTDAGVNHASANEVGLIVTCDCGVTAHAAVQDARDRGMDVVVTDHHLTTTLPPANAVVNPNRADDTSDAGVLCGTGVAFKLAQALVTELSLPEHLPLHLLDHVALATVADLVPLSGENRTLVRFGLKSLSASRWPGIRALVETAGFKGKAVRAGHVGFILAPRLNAVGRIGDAIEGLRLLLCDDEREATERAQKLETINAERQDIDRAILQEAIERIDESVDLDATYGLVLAQEGWHPGVIGIVASRVVEHYARPTILIGLDGGHGKGSGRSIPPFDLHHALTECGHHLEKYGGHKMAAGLSIEAGKVSGFSEAFNDVARAALTADDLVHTRRVDRVLEVGALDFRLEKLLRHFEPSGIGNPAPVFAVEDAAVADPREVGQGHLKFTIADPTGRLSAIGFGLCSQIPEDWLKGDVDIAFRLEENEYQGVSSLQARVLDLKPSVS